MDKTKKKMTRKTLKDLIKERENLELKSSLSLIDEIIEAVSAFSNTEGGRVIVGVDNAGRIVGVEIGKGTIENLANRIAQNTDPRIHPKISVKEIEGKKITVIEIKESIDKLVLAFGKPFKRVGKSTMRMSKDEYEMLILEKHKGRLQFDKQVCEGANLEDIDWKFVKERFISLYEKVSGKRIVSNPQSLLESLDCIKNNKPTNAGILLFGKNPQKFYMNSYIALARYKDNAIGGERLDYKEFQGNIIEQIDNCNKYIKEHIAVMSRLLPHNIQREDIPEYGWFSIRELITNAISHRDYENQHTKVIIKFFDNRMEFYNPGGLPNHITPKNIIKKQFSRNPIIAKILAKIKYIEELGEGWDKIMDEHKTHPLKPAKPKIETDEHAVLINIFSVKEKFEKEKGVEPLERLTDKEKKIIELISKQRSIKSGDVQGMFGVSRDTANRYLNRLIKLKMISRKGIGKAAYYALK